MRKDDGQILYKKSINNYGEMYCLNNTWHTTNLKPNKGPLHLSVMFNSLRADVCHNGTEPDQITFCPAKGKKGSVCEGKGPILLMNGNGVLPKTGFSGWAWAGIIGGVVLLGAVVFLVIKSKPTDDHEEVTERHTSEMVDQNLFKKIED